MNADLRPLLAETIACGGHIRFGLKDAPLGTPPALVEEAERIVRDHGAEPASAAEMRQALGSSAGGN